MDFSLWIFLAAALSYFVPILIARYRNVHSRGGILLLNVLLGWTGLGWIAALLWACTAESVDQVELRGVLIRRFGDGS